MECLDMKNNSSSKKTSYITRGAMIFLYHAISQPDSGNG